MHLLLFHPLSLPTRLSHPLSLITSQVGADEEDFEWMLEMLTITSIDALGYDGVRAVEQVLNVAAALTVSFGSVLIGGGKGGGYISIVSFKVKTVVVQVRIALPE